MFICNMMFWTLGNNSPSFLRTWLKYMFPRYLVFCTLYKDTFICTYHTCILEWHIHGVQEKLGFFTIHCNPSLAYIAVLETFKALNAMWVYSHSYWMVFFVQPIAAECWQGRGGKLSRILEKKPTIFNEHPVYSNIHLAFAFNVAM